MRLKTFLATYLLFLAILFSSVGIVSFYLNNSQINMLKDKSTGQFQTIVSSLNRDIAVLWGREGISEARFYEAVNELVRGYARYYSRHGILLGMSGARVMPEDAMGADAMYGVPTTHSPVGTPYMASEMEIVFEDDGDGRYFIFISGPLTGSFGHFMLEYRLNATENIRDMRSIQNTLLISAIAFSVIAAFGLYLILTSIFRPLTVVAKAAREIADEIAGQVRNDGGSGKGRVPTHWGNGKNELAQVALDFNKMAEKIEGQILLLEEEAENKQQFVDNFAHEMRTPLTSIYGYAEYMQKALLDEGEIVELSGRIMDKAEYLEEIADSLLKLAMLRDYRADEKEIDLRGLFEDIRGMVEVAAAAQGVEFSCCAYVKTIIGQEDLIKSLLLNLCFNGLKACFGDGESKERTAERIYPGYRAGERKFVYLGAKEENGEIVLSVRDNGCGIPDESLSKVTEPFYRVDKARDRESGGAGLGLTLCRKIAEAHGAEMVIESVVGEGTIVKVGGLKRG